MQKRSYTNHKKRGVADKLLYALPVAALLTTAGLGVAKYTLNNIDSASAVYTPAMGNVVTAGALVDMSLGVAIDDDSKDILRIVPDANGVFDQGDINVTVNTSDIFGYKLLMYAYEPNTTTPTTSLTNVSATLSGGTHPTIETLASGSSYTAAEFASNAATKDKWGYKLNDEDKFVPVQSTTLVKENGTYGSTKQKVTIGAKVSNSIPNGLYQVTLNFVAIANAPEAGNAASNFETAFAYAGVMPYKDTQHYAMQDMTDTICGYVYTPSASETDTVKSIQLVDKRDEKLYWVSKLADGKCWMTQNLDFDITGPLTSDTTDLKTTMGALYAGDDKGYTLGSNGLITWTPARNTYKITRETTGTNGEIGTATDKWTNDNFTPYSVDAGNWYMNGTYFNSTDCNDVSWSTGCNFLDNNKSTAHNGETLSDFFAQTPYQGNGEHGSVGNWYNWSAAMASNNTTNAAYGVGTNPNTGADEVNTICPKGWTLPVTAADATQGASDVAGTYGYLNKIYNNSLTNNDAGLYNSPFYGVRGGVIYTNSGLSTLYDAGRVGHYWSGTASTATSGYYLGFRSAGVNTINSGARGGGRSLRCLAL